MNTMLIETNIKKLTLNLLNHARKNCFNKFSDNIIYMVHSFYPEDYPETFKEVDRINMNLYKKGQFLSRSQLVNFIINLDTKLTWVDMSIFLSTEEMTLILVELVLSEKDNEEINYHMSIKIPPEIFNEEEKFDINWYYLKNKHILERFSFKDWLFKRKKK